MTDIETTKPGSVATQPGLYSQRHIEFDRANNNFAGGEIQVNPCKIIDFPLPRVGLLASHDGYPTTSFIKGALALDAKPFVAVDWSIYPMNDDFAPDRARDELVEFYSPREAEVVDFQMTKFINDTGILSKVISLNSDGDVVSDGSACRMTSGIGFRVWLKGFTGLANFIDNLQSNEAAALGSLPADVGDSVKIVSQKQLNQINFVNAISRTKKYFVPEKGAPMALLLDHDLKGMTPEVRARLQEMAKTLSTAEQERFGEKAGFIAAVRSLIEGFDGLGYVLRDSTSGGLYIPATDTTPGWESPGKANCHLYLIIRDGADAYRAIRALQDRAWLAGFGWHWISKGGHLLKRSIVDITVASPERLIFEGLPVVKPPLAKYPRKSEVREGRLLDSRTIRNLDAGETAALDKLLSASAAALGKELKVVRARVIEERVREAVEKGADEARARKAFSRMFDGEQITLYPDVVLRFDNPELGAVSVGDALFDPKRYDGKVLADPIEPCGEGDFLLTNKAIFFLGEDHGDPMIFSNLHGGQLYRLRHDADSIADLIDSFADGDVRVVDAFAEAMVLGGAESPVGASEESLIDQVMKKARIKGKKFVTTPLKAARGKRKEDEKAVRDAARADEAGGDSGGSGDGTLGAPPLTLDDFYAYSPDATFIHRGTGGHWPAASVDGRVPPVPDGTPKGQKATDWLHKNRAVEQSTWAPGEPEVIYDRVVLQGGWSPLPGARVFNLYKPAIIRIGDCNGAGKWVDHLHVVYPDEAEHMIDYMAFKVQHPGEKINHALIMGGEPKVGKDSLLEGWRYAIGSANWAETTPKAMLNSQFNGYRKSVVLRINECHDLGEHSRYELYDHMKDLSASGPFALPVNEKHRAEYYIPNATAPVLTTNHRLVFYVLANDRRNFFCWSVCNGSEFDETYWNAFYAWYEAGGYENVAAYLKARDLSRFDPKAAPFKTPWFWESVESSRDAEEPEMLDTIEKIGLDQAFTLDDLKGQAAVTMDLWDLLSDPKKRRVVSHRLEKCGYMPVRNPDVTSGLWMVAGKRKVVYAARDLSPSAQMDAVRRRIKQAEGDAAEGDAAQNNAAQDADIPF